MEIQEISTFWSGLELAVIWIGVRGLKVGVIFSVFEEIANLLDFA